MKELLTELTTNQTILAIAPIVTLGIIAGIAGLYFARKERLESERQQAMPAAPKQSA
jgi:hypothetical protein